MIRFRTGVAAAGLALAATITSIGPAGAEPVSYDWTWYESGSSNNLAYAAYDRDTEVLRIDDQEADGHNVFAYIDGPWWDDVRCWDAGGWEGSGSFCDLTDNYEDNTEVDVQLCIGDWERAARRSNAAAIWGASTSDRSAGCGRGVALVGRHG